MINLRDELNAYTVMKNMTDNVRIRTDEYESDTDSIIYINDTIAFYVEWQYGMIRILAYENYLSNMIREYSDSIVEVNAEDMLEVFEKCIY